MLVRIANTEHNRDLLFLEMMMMFFLSVAVSLFFVG